MLQQVLYRHIIMVLLFCAMPTVIFAQDSPLSQWCNDMLATNPAFAGSADRLRLNIFYRNQWPKSDAKFQYYGGSVDMPIVKNMGIGLLFSNDQMSFLSHRRADVAYSYKIEADNDKTIFLGLKLGVMQKLISTSDLIFEQNETLPSNASKIRTDAGLGAAAMLKKIFASVAVEHLLRPYQSLSENRDSRTNIKFTFDIGYVYKFSPLTKKNDIEIMPNFIYQQQGKQQNLQIGVISQVDWLMAGLSVRKNIGSDAPLAVILLGYKKLDLRIAYSYDLDLNQKTNHIGNAHELSITKLFDIKRKEKKKTIECPSFLQ